MDPARHGATSLESGASVISYADTADLSLAAKLLSTHAATPAPGAINLADQAAQLAAALRSAITGDGAQALKAQAGNASPDLARLLGGAI